MNGTRSIVEFMLDIVKNLSAAFHANDMEKMKQIKKDSEMLKIKIDAVRGQPDREMLENAGQELDKLVSAVEEKIAGKMLFSEKALGEANTLFSGLVDFLGNARDYLMTENRVIQTHLQNEVNKYTGYARDFATMHEERLVQGICLARASGVYVNMLYAFSGVFYNIGKVVA